MEFIPIRDAILIAADRIREGYAIQVFEVRGGIDFLLTKEGEEEIYLETSN